MRELFEKLTLSLDMASNNKRMHLKYPKSLYKDYKRSKCHLRIGDETPASHENEIYPHETFSQTHLASFVNQLA